MQGRRIRALVLAAGLGTRLRPLTSLTPKPLLPVRGVPILGHTLAQLAAVGCEAVAVNLHYLGDQIRQRFGDSHAGMPLTWSEEPEVLGTLAGDDTIFLAVKDSAAQRRVVRAVRRLGSS